MLYYIYALTEFQQIRTVSVVPFNLPNNELTMHTCNSTMISLTSLLSPSSLKTFPTTTLHNVVDTWTTLSLTRMKQVFIVVSMWSTKQTITGISKSRQHGTVWGKRFVNVANSNVNIRMEINHLLQTRMRGNDTNNVNVWNAPLYRHKC